ncbi:MAG: ATP-dependent Clp protease proteolytic subunit [Planctomycetes bacterium]|nr:ATP-dependent Clp protease proteolytic subunit [Planctomycetota bacterium]
MTYPILDNDEPEEKPDKMELGFLKHLLKARTILVEEVVTDTLSRKVHAQLIALQQMDDKAPITVYINSPGGSADSGFAIYDFMRFVKPPIRTVVVGLCASAAVMIHLAAPRDRRLTLPNSRFLLHQPSTMMFGAASDIAINAEEIVKLRERYNQIVAAETGKSVDQVTKDADRDFWLSAPQAKEYGLVSRIVKSIGEVEKA